MAPRSPVALVVASGVAAGALGRDAPVVVAGWLIEAPHTESCTMERSLECAVRDGPSILGAFALFLLAVVGVAAAMALAAAVLLAMGGARLRTASPGGSDSPASGTGPVGRVDPLAIALLGGGAALAVPPLWLAGLAVLGWLG